MSKLQILTYYLPQNSETDQEFWNIISEAVFQSKNQSLEMKEKDYTKVAANHVRNKSNDSILDVRRISGSMMSQDWVSPENQRRMDKWIFGTNRASNMYKYYIFSIPRFIYQKLWEEKKVMTMCIGGDF